MHERQIRWNERYARGEETHAYAPSPPLPEAVQALAAAPAGDRRAPSISMGPQAAPNPSALRALDIACGAGRHALYLAERGFHVVAVDWAQAGLDALVTEARRRGVEERIDPVLADIEAGGFVIEPARYDIACDFYFLSRPLFAAMRDGVRPGGLFVAAIHVESERGAAPHRFLLAPGELRRMVVDWGFEVLHERDGQSREAGHDHATAEIVARRPV